jgi:hypothetical protein
MQQVYTYFDKYDCQMLLKQGILVRGRSTLGGGGGGGGGQRGPREVHHHPNKICLIIHFLLFE